MERLLVFMCGHCEVVIVPSGIYAFGSLYLWHMGMGLPQRQSLS